MKAGAADLLPLWKPGKCGFIELKSENGRTSPAQQAFGIRLSELGISYAVCKSIGDVEGTLAAWGAPVRGKVNV